MKRAQVVTQVFVYVAAAALFLSLLLFGYKFIVNILDSQDTVILTDFRADFAAKVEQLKVRRGSVVQQDFRLPQEYHKLCVADSTGRSALGLETQFPQFANAWKSNTENVFLLPKQDVPIFIEDVEVDGGFFCVDVDGVFKLRLEGTGRTTRVSPS